MRNAADRRILDVLISLAPTIEWLIEVEPIPMREIPKANLIKVKQLENLGLVYRRNSRNCALQRQRLAKLLEREIQQVSSERKEQYLCAFSSVLSWLESEVQAN